MQNGISQSFIRHDLHKLALVSAGCFDHFFGLGNELLTLIQFLRGEIFAVIIKDRSRISFEAFFFCIEHWLQIIKQILSFFIPPQSN
ncbi:hypothetical protein D3C87_1927120 [compost metagenome]